METILFCQLQKLHTRRSGEAEGCMQEKGTAAPGVCEKSNISLLPSVFFSFLIAEQLAYVSYIIP